MQIFIQSFGKRKSCRGRIMCAVYDVWKGVIMMFFVRMEVMKKDICRNAMKFTN